MLHYDASNYWSATGPNTIHCQHDSNKISSFSKWHKIADYDIYYHVDATATESLERSSHNEHSGAVSAAAYATPEGEECNDKDSYVAAAEYIGELAIQWLDCGTTNPSAANPHLHESKRP